MNPAVNPSLESVKMKKSIRFSAIISIVFIFLSCLEEETQNQLEQRLDSLLSEMSIQEKIEQLYYRTDGNERLGFLVKRGQHRYISRDGELISSLGTREDNILFTSDLIYGDIPNNILSDSYAKIKNPDNH